MKRPIVTLFTEKGQTDIVEIIRAIFIIIVLAWVGWVIAGTFGWQETIIEIGKLLLIGVVVVSGIYLGYRIYHSKKEAEELRRIEAERRQIEAEKRAFEEEQQKKGLVKFVDRFGNEKWGKPGEVKKWKKEDDEVRIKESLEHRVVQAIKEFEPARKLRDEYVYENSLYSWLKSQFPKIKVQVQRGSSRPDIAIENIAIEIKGPTHRTDQLDSVLGKLLRYPQHFEKIIVVLFDVTVSDSYYDEWLEGLKKKFPEVEVIRKD